MGKQGEKKKKQKGPKSGDSKVKKNKGGVNSPGVYDKDMVVFISMAQELKGEGNRLFQKRDYDGAMFNYEKAIKLLPGNHIDVSHLRSNMAACYMQMGLSEYPRAIHECNLALEVAGNYSKALLKRARCYEALNKLDLALRDVRRVLQMEPNNLLATEIADRLKVTIEKNGVGQNDLIPIPEYVDPPPVVSSSLKASKEKAPKNKSNKNVGEEAQERNEEAKGRGETNMEEAVAKNKKFENGALKRNGRGKREQKKPEEQNKEKKEKYNEEDEFKDLEKQSRRMVKLIYGEDIRCAQISINSTILELREIIHERFPSSKSVLVKYRDREGDLVTITTNEELRWAEASVEHSSVVRLYIVDVSPDQDPFFEKVWEEEELKQNHRMGNGVCVDDWIIHFANLFKNIVGFECDTYLDLQEVGMKFYSEAMEETVTSEEAQDLFLTAAEKFQEMAALALFNWGNVHMSRGRKRVYLTEDMTGESVLTKVKSAHVWAEKEYSTAGNRYEDALKIKPNFYEAILALGLQQFELAKLSWYYAISTNADLESWPSMEETFQLYNNAEENMERGMQMWEEDVEQNHSEMSKLSKTQTLLQKMKLDCLFRELSADEAADQASNMRSQINLSWGSMLYERSMMEFKLGVPAWQESLEFAVEKFELAGASPTDIAVMMKSHCSNTTAPEGIGFNIDEIVQAWNEMYKARRWKKGVPSFRLEPLLRRRVSKLYHALELA